MFNTLQVVLNGKIIRNINAKKRREKLSRKDNRVLNIYDIDYRKNRHQYLTLDVSDYGKDRYSLLKTLRFLLSYTVICIFSNDDMI